jgi:hypothetical protein
MSYSTIYVTHLCAFARNVVYAQAIHAPKHLRVDLLHKTDYIIVLRENLKKRDHLTGNTSDPTIPI